MTLSTRLYGETEIEFKLEFFMGEYLTPAVAWLGKFLQDNWQIGLSALSGTFLGAYFAFLFERRHSEKREHEAIITAAKYAQFVIQAQLNGVKNIKKQVLDPKREDKERHLTLTPYSVHVQYPSLDIGSLAFMLKGDGAQLLNEMMLSEHKFRTLIGVLEQRNIRHESMQHRLAQHGPSEFGLRKNGIGMVF